jgi:hypothetical protein
MNKKLIVGFEVLKAMVMKSPILWDTTSCNLLKFSRRFGGTCLCLHGGRVNQTRNQQRQAVSSALQLPIIWSLSVIKHRRFSVAGSNILNFSVLCRD